MQISPSEDTVLDGYAQYVVDRCIIVVEPSTTIILSEQSKVILSSNSLLADIKRTLNGVAISLNFVGHESLILFLALSTDS